ncbi:MAG: flippase-like domain-containing protein [Coriobacteriia bacterium]|nr:flippase-like domain-containing protein [Coriobacteriia bacterium]
MLNVQWYQIAKFAQLDISFRDMLRINCQGSIIDSVTPGVKIGGEVVRAVQISRAGKCSGEEGAAIVAVQKIVSLSTFIFVNLFVVGYLVGIAPFLQVRYLQVGIYGVLGGLLLLFVGVFLFADRLLFFTRGRGAQLSCSSPSKWAQMRIKAQGFMIVTLSQILLLRGNVKLCVSLLVLSFLVWLMYPLKMYILIAQLYPDTSIAVIAAITFTAYLAALIPLFPGGLGGFEGTMVTLLVATGLAQSGALVATILFRFITFWLVMVFSLAYLALDKIDFSKMRRSERATIAKEGKIKRGYHYA